MRSGNEQGGALCKRSRASGAVVFSITPMRVWLQRERDINITKGVHHAHARVASTLARLILSILPPTGVYNINTSSRPTGTSRQHIKKNIVLLDSNRGSKSNIVTLAPPPKGNTRQQALRKLRKDRYGWCCVHCTQHLPSRWKRPPSFMVISIRVVLFLIETTPADQQEHPVNALWNLAFVSEKVKSSRRREDLSSPTYTPARVILESKRGQP